MRSLFVGRWYSYLLIALVIAPLITVYAYQDDLTVVFNSWSSGEPKIMVKLEIHIPPVNAESCGVAVLRLPSLYRPTKTGFSEEVYVGIHRPGETIVVKELLAAIVAKTKIEDGEYKVEYYEPVEYLIAVACMRDNKTTHKYTKIHEIYPNKLITTHKIEVELKEQQTSKVVSEESVGSYETDPFSCNFTPVSPPPNVLEAAECNAWVRGPYLYSLPGLKTSFGLLGGPIPSAVYLTSYADAAYCPTYGNCYPPTPQWDESDKVLVYSVISGETAQLTGRWKDRVYFHVRFRYEKRFGGTMPAGILVWLIYPVEILDLTRSGTSPILPYEKQFLWYIPPAPSYSTGPVIGNRTIWFTPPHISDPTIVSTSVTFSFSAFGVVTLSISFHKAGRNDNYYTTPYVRVIDVSGINHNWYYWWYRDNDRMTYEVLFSFYS